jgi:hypothetical protein
MERPVLQIPRLPREELRQLVLDIADNRCLTAADVPQEMLGMVFLPVFMGALHPSSEMLLPRPPNPVLEPIPAEPNLPEMPPVPEEPVPPAPPPYPMEQMELVRWGRLLEADVLLPYQKMLAQHKILLEKWRQTIFAQYENALCQHEANSQVVQAERARLLLEHELQLEAVRTRNAALEAAHAQELEAWEAECRQAAKLWAADLGTVYEYYDKALPRAINGYPIFASFRILHREDWALVRGAVNRELERRKNDDLLGGL